MQNAKSPERSPKRLDGRTLALLTALQRSSSTSSLPSASRNISNLCHPALSAKGNTFMPEYVGGLQRWRFSSTEYQSDRSTRQETFQQKAAATCPHTLHPVTIAGGWDRKVKQNQDEVLKKFGYVPGMPRSKSQESRLSEFLPSSWRAFSGEFKAVPKPKINESSAAPSHICSVEPGERASSPSVEIQTLKDIRIVKFNPDGDRLIVKRWQAGFNEVPASRVAAHEHADPDRWQDGLRRSHDPPPVSSVQGG